MSVLAGLLADVVESIVKAPEKSTTSVIYDGHEASVEWKHLGTLVWLPAGVNSIDYFRERIAKAEARLARQGAN